MIQENARVIELHVRMDCNGCVQKIKKAIHGIDGVYSVQIDLAQQKVTVVGSFDPDKIVRAIKKTRKTTTICPHTEWAPEPSEPPTEAAPPAEPPQDAPPAENPAHDIKPSPEDDIYPDEPKDTTEPRMVHYYPHRYAYREHWNHNYSAGGHEIYQEAPYCMTRSCSSYRPSRFVRHTRYGAAEADNDGYYQSRCCIDGNQISSMFSDENPNACRIV